MYLKSVREENMHPIPLVDLKEQGHDVLVDLFNENVKTLLAAGRKAYTPIFYWIADPISKRFLKRTHNPYSQEIERVANKIKLPGIYALNISFEWGCTAGVSKNTENNGVELLRVLDWPLDGLGANCVVARHNTPVGEYYNVTWPGFVGVMNAMAPNRFAASINQAPMPKHGLTLFGDWIKNRWIIFNHQDLPPAHLLRQVFEECSTYLEAKKRLIESPICVPALFSLAGIDEGCIIERKWGKAFVHEAPSAIANQWITVGLHGHVRGEKNTERQQDMQKILASENYNSFDWVKPPILNNKTRLAFMANAKTGQLKVQGWEEVNGQLKIATQVFELPHRIK